MAPALCQRRDGLQRLLPARPVPLAQQVGLTLERPFDGQGERAGWQTAPQ